MSLHSRLQDRLKMNSPIVANTLPQAFNYSVALDDSAVITQIKLICQQRAAEDNAFYRPDSEETRAELVPRVETLIREVAQEQKYPLTELEIKRLGVELLDEIYGLGRLEYLMADPTISDILINGHKHIFIERNGILEETPLTFISEEHLRNKVDRMLHASGRRVDEASPMVDARLADGSRLNVIIPPLAINGITVSIRRFPRHHLRAKDLLIMGTLVQPMYNFLDMAIKARMNILICGGTGSGKTTTLNMLSGLIPHEERIITIEDSAELRLQQEHVVCLESRPANTEGAGAISQRDLLRNALRMRPDRIIIGEVRGAEVLDMLQAMNTGHDGSMATVHANNPRDSISRLELMITLSGINLTDASIRRQVVSALDLIIHIDRGEDGVRRIVSITEISGIDDNMIILQEIFNYENYPQPRQGKRGIFRATGVRPSCGNRNKNLQCQHEADFFNCAIEV